MPAVGLGVWKVPKEACAATVVSAIRSGYRHLDCACDYGNEKEVGDGIRRASKQPTSVQTLGCPPRQIGIEPSA